VFQDGSVKTISSESLRAQLTTEPTSGRHRRVQSALKSDWTRRQTRPTRVNTPKSAHVKPPSQRASVQSASSTQSHRHDTGEPTPHLPRFKFSPANQTVSDSHKVTVCPDERNQTTQAAGLTLGHLRSGHSYRRNCTLPRYWFPSLPF